MHYPELQQFKLLPACSVANNKAKECHVFATFDTLPTPVEAFVALSNSETWVVVSLHSQATEMAME